MEILKKQMLKIFTISFYTPLQMKYCDWLINFTAPSMCFSSPLDNFYLNDKCIICFGSRCALEGSFIQ